MEEKVLKRYERQIGLKHFGFKKQEILRNSTVTVFGAGGLGSIILYYLAAAGVGTIKIIDYDRVELSNLNRQILHFTKDINKYKVDSAKYKLKQLNPDIIIRTINKRIISSELNQVIGHTDIIIDGLDNFKTRFFINTYAVKNKIPLFHAAVQAYSGQFTTILPGETPCLACLFDTIPRTKVYVLGACVGVIGSITALNAIKFLINGTIEPNKNKLFIFDSENCSIVKIKTKKNLHCKVCGGRH